MRELNLVVLEKSELQHRRKSKLIALFGISSVWGSQNEMYQQKCFPSNLVFLEPGETKALEKLIAKKQKN